MWTPDRAVAISLPRRTDRREHLTRMQQRLPFELEVLDAVDGNTVDVPATWRASPAAWGNAQSHLAALSGPGESFLVLEDDALIPGHFTESVQRVMGAVPRWEIIMLGGEHTRPPAAIAPGVVRCTGTYRSIGYIVRGDAVAETRTAITRAATHWDSGWQVVQRRRMTVAADPFTIRPADLGSDIPDSVPYGILPRT